MASHSAPAGSESRVVWEFRHKRDKRQKTAGDFTIEGMKIMEGEEVEGVEIITHFPLGISPLKQNSYRLLPPE